MSPVILQSGWTSAAPPFAQWESSLFLGNKAARDGAVIDYLGRPSTQIFTLGSAAKGMLFETTAVPELRLQAKALAERLTRVPVSG